VRWEESGGEERSGEERRGEERRGEERRGDERRGEERRRDARRREETRGDERRAGAGAYLDPSVRPRPVVRLREYSLAPAVHTVPRRGHWALGTGH
jgi:hypothetical protein